MSTNYEDKTRQFCDSLERLCLSYYVTEEVGINDYYICVSSDAENVKAFREDAVHTGKFLGVPEEDYLWYENGTDDNESEEDDCQMDVSILIDDFEKWASTSRLYQGYNGEELGFGGKFYVTLSEEVREALERRHLFFDTVVKSERYSTTVGVSAPELEELLFD